MREKGFLVFGGSLIILGALIFLSNLFHINFWAFCGPTALILIGVWLLFQPQLKIKGTDLKIRLLGDIRHGEDWEVNNENFLIFVGDARFDFTQADIPSGETRIILYGFVGGVKITIPPREDLGLAITTIGLVNDTRIYGKKRETFLAPIYFQSEGYSAAERKIHFEINYFIVDLDVYPA